MDDAPTHGKIGLIPPSHAERTEIIARLEQQILHGTGIEEALETVAEAAARGLGVSCSGIFLDPEDGNGTTLKAGLGWRDGWIGRRVGVFDENTREGRPSADRAPVVVDLSIADPFPAGEFLKIHGIRSGVSVEFQSRKGMKGLLGAFSPEAARFDATAADFLNALAQMLVIAVDRGRDDEQAACPARLDSLTGLPNRHLFLERLGQAMELAKHRQSKVGVVFADLDHFKVVNDAMGQSTGDRLLVQIAQRLQRCVRSGDTVARLGGDEFAFVLSGMAQARDATLVAEKVIAALSVPCEVEGKKVYVSASLGISVYPGDGTDMDGLLGSAGAAMFQAKENGPAIYQFYLPQMNERADARLKLETQLRGALARDEFVLYYQPKASLASGRVTGFEALLRWRHPVLGLMPPLQFIPILEDTGLIVSVGEWIVLAACEQITRWKHQGLEPHPISVNLSARQFQQRNLSSVIERTLRTTGIDPGLLEFELAEPLLMQEVEAAVHALEHLKRFGVRISMDDFGTGYSSLAHLKRLPLDVLKIDRAFIQDVTLDPDDATIAAAMIKLAHSLGLKVVAEGVETREQVDFLIRNGCDEMQGYYFSHPLPLDGASRVLAENQQLPLH